MQKCGSSYLYMQNKSHVNSTILFNVTYDILMKSHYASYKVENERTKGYTNKKRLRANIVFFFGYISPNAIMSVQP